MARTLITVPSTAKSGEIIEVKALVQHPMETGYRRSSDGAMLPRDLIRKFTCRFVAGAGAASAVNASGSGDLVFEATFHAAIAANPYLAFHFRAVSNGALVFLWEGDKGFAQREAVTITVA
jgi:sulfur-oxidizing protein SoxZ